MTECDVNDCTNEGIGTYRIEEAVVDDPVVTNELCKKHYRKWRGIIEEI